MGKAPVIKYNGEKFQEGKLGKAIRNHELEAAIANGLGERDFAAYKVIMFLTGNAQGFGVAEKTICERCNISESAYKKARSKLVQMGWITHIQGKEIIVNYDEIYKGYTENTPERQIENTHNNINNNIKDNITLQALTPEAINSFQF